MLHVLITQLLRSVVCLGVIIPVRHAQAILVSLRDDHCAVLIVLAGSETEERRDPECVQMRDFLQHIIAIFYAIDSLELVSQWLGTRDVYRRFVHPTGIIIADLFCVWIGSRRFLSRAFGDVMKRVIILFDY